MKQRCKCELQNFMADYLFSYRKDHRLSQEKLAGLLLIDRRSYVDLEHGEYLCCTLTLLCILTFCCEDTSALLQQFREILLRYLSDDADPVA